VNILKLLVVVGLLVASLPNVAVARDGPAVLLRNGQVFYGKAKEEGDRVIVEDEHSTYRLSRQQVLCWADNVDALYQYRVDHRPANSAKQHLADAEWCINNGLFGRAAEEIIALRTLTGDSSAADAMEKRLRLLVEQTAVQAEEKNASTADSKNLSGSSPAAAVLSVADEAGEVRSQKPLERMVTHGEKPTPVIHNIENAESVHRFTDSIQPMLLNRCATAGCHGLRAVAAPKFEGWRSGVTAKLTSHNMRQLAPLINFEDPSKSRLIEMASSPHGGSETLSGKLDTQLRERLIQWVYLAAGVSRPEAPSIPEAETASLPRADDGYRIAPAIFAPESAATVPVRPPSPPVRLPSVLDPFDPEVFNRSFR
jgi:hypothetical protein